jgi:hypothetical protein
MKILSVEILFLYVPLLCYLRVGFIDVVLFNDSRFSESVLPRNG